ncbi:MAG: hypothetical protein VXX30_06220, partial [Planctomycetota bacterium]|nr:hypothetical protein [Planctomycetota bacterium]
ALRRTREAQRALLEHLESHDPEVALEDDVRLADLLISAGLPGVARDHLDEALERHPMQFELLKRAAFARFDGGDRRGGDRLSRTLRRLDPADPRVHENLVLSAIRGGQLRLAHLRLRRALERCPESESLRRLRGFLVVQRIPSLLRGIWSGFAGRS